MTTDERESIFYFPENLNDPIGGGLLRYPGPVNTKEEERHWLRALRHDLMDRQRLRQGAPVRRQIYDDWNILARDCANIADEAAYWWQLEHPFEVF